MDALSEEGGFGLTLIAFIGSVFSPYYAWSGRRDPFNHCALNVALYGPRAARWTMTERGRSDVELAPDLFRLSRSRLAWTGDGLEIEIDEHGAPLPRPVQGRVRVRFDALNEAVFPIDQGGRHLWRPIAPLAHVEVEMRRPDLSWSGRGYLDTNNGVEPLEDRFAYWDWSRIETGPDETTVLYTTDEVASPGRALSLRFDAAGGVSDGPPVEPSDLNPTPVWRMARRAQSAKGAPRLVRTLEDTPFYSRSVIEADLGGGPRRGVHESLSGGRLRSPLVKAMLPFRMPRLAGGDRRR